MFTSHIALFLLYILDFTIFVIYCASHTDATSKVQASILLWLTRIFVLLRSIRPWSNVCIFHYACYTSDPVVCVTSSLYLNQPPVLFSEYRTGMRHPILTQNDHFKRFFRCNYRPMMSISVDSILANISAPGSEKCYKCTCESKRFFLDVWTCGWNGAIVVWLHPDCSRTFFCAIRYSKPWSVSYFW